MQKQKFASLLVGSCLLAHSSQKIAHTCKSAKSLPKPSGIYGQVLRIGFPPLNPNDYPNAPSIGDRIPISNCLVVVRHASSEIEVKRARTDRYGTFKITLPPGKYEVEPLNDPPPQFGDLKGSKETVTVWSGYYSGAKAIFDGGW